MIISRRQIVISILFGLGILGITCTETNQSNTQLDSGIFVGSDDGVEVTMCVQQGGSHCGNYNTLGIVDKA